jgi:hypothetical protein
MKGDKVELTELTELQAAKWFLLRERRRHLEDIQAINIDLWKLRNIEMPKTVLDILDKYFEIPKRV